MALLTATRPTAAGVTWSPAAVSSSDTIAIADLGTRGAYLVVINGGGSSDDVTVSDAGSTPAGNPANVTAVAVGAGASKAVLVSPRAADLGTGLVTVTHSATTSVTYVLLPVG